MRYFVFALLSIISLPSFTDVSFYRKGIGFQLQGTIIGLNEGTKVFLVKYSTSDTIAKTKIKNNRFVLKGIVPNGTEYYHICLDSTVSKKRSQDLLLVNSVMHLKGNIKEWPKVTLTGSSPHDDLQEFSRPWQSISAMILETKENITRFPEKKDSLHLIFEELSSLRLARIRDFILTHTHSLYTPDLIRKTIQFSNDERGKMYNNLENSVKSSFFGEQLKAEIETVRQRKLIKVNSIIPNFKIAPIGRNLSNIHEIASQNRITLISFWASWCRPCRQQVPNLKHVYNSFKDKGFCIVGIALNDKETAWKRALMEDDSPWLNCRDINNELYKLFDIQQIPAYILVNSKAEMLCYYCTGSDIGNFGPAIKGQSLYNTIDSLVNRMH